MKPEISDSFPILSEEDITVFEYRNKIDLPKEYITFLLEHNGGKPNPGSFKIPIPNFEISSRISMFVGIHNGNSYSLARYLRSHASRIPKNMLVIATDIFGSLVCISIAGKDFGKIYWWSHEEETIYLISNRFDEFLDGLYLYDDNNENNDK